MAQQRERERVAGVLERFVQSNGADAREWNAFLDDRTLESDLRPMRDRARQLDPMVNVHGADPEPGAMDEIKQMVATLRGAKKMADTIKVDIKRQNNPDAPARTERFEIPYRKGMNITSLLGEIAMEPTTADGRASTPISYDANCLEEICGSCAMLINGKARMACSALVDKLMAEAKDGVITLAPLSKFPVVRDLAVDRSVLFENLKAVKAWVPADGSYDLGPGPKQFPQVQEERYPLSNCISCTICMEVCPQFNEQTGFVGAATIAQVKLFNLDPAGKQLKEERLRALAGDGGVQECGYAQNCVQACPKQLPLTEAISDVSRDVIVQQVKDFFVR